MPNARTIKAGVGGCALGVLLMLAPSAARADAPVAGITIGMAVAAVAARLGPPLRVDSGDAGTAFIFARGRTVYVDDDGMVLAVELRSGTPRIDVDGATRSFAIGTYAAARADAELAGVAEFATPAQRSYRLAPRRDLALTFDAGSQRLTRVTYGEPGQLARLGLLPGDGASKAVVYHAPRMLAGAVVPPPTPSAAEFAVFRLAIDRSGAVTEVDDALPSPQTAADAAAARRLRLGRYQPATLDGRPIAATLFVEMRP